MAPEIEFDAVEIVVRRDLRNRAAGEIAHLGLAVVDRRPHAALRRRFLRAEQERAVLLLEFRPEQRISRIVRVVHPHRPEHLLSHFPAVLAYNAQCVRAERSEIRQQVVPVAAFADQERLRRRRAMGEASERAAGGVEHHRVDVRAHQRRGAQREKIPRLRQGIGRHARIAAAVVVENQPPGSRLGCCPSNCGRSQGQVEPYPRGKHAVLRAPGVFGWNDPHRRVGLHPLRHRYPGLVLADLRHAEVAEPRAVLGHEDPLGRPQHHKPVRVDLRHEQRSAMPEDVIVARAAAGVDEEKRVAVRDPVLLGVVAPKVGAVIPGPGARNAEVQSVAAGRHVRRLVVAHAKEEAVAEFAQRRFVETAAAGLDDLAADFANGDLGPIEAAPHDGRAVVGFTLRLEIERHQHRTVGQVDALRAARAGVVEARLGWHRDGAPRGPRARGRIVEGENGFARALVDDGIVAVANAMPDSEQLPGRGVPLGPEVAGAHRGAIRLRPLAEGRGMFG